MQDHAKPIRTALIANTPALTDLDIKRQRAIASMGSSYMLHPEYQFNPRHAFSAAGWQPHSVLRQVAMRAQQAGRI